MLTNSLSSLSSFFLPLWNTNSNTGSKYPTKSLISADLHSRAIFWAAFVRDVHLLCNEPPKLSVTLHDWSLSLALITVQQAAFHMVTPGPRFSTPCGFTPVATDSFAGSLLSGGQMRKRNIAENLPSGRRILRGQAWKAACPFFLCYCLIHLEVT